MPNNYEDKYEEIKRRLQRSASNDDTRILSRDEIDSYDNKRKSNLDNEINNNFDKAYYDSLVGNIKNEIAKEDMFEREQRYIEEQIDYKRPINSWDEYEKQKESAKNIETSSDSIFSINIPVNNEYKADEVSQFMKDLKSKDKKVVPEKRKFKWINYILLFLVATFGVLSIISLHSTYLIIKPLNYLCIVIAIASLSILVYRAILCIQMGKIKKENRIKLKKKDIVFRVLMNIYVIGCISFCLLLYGPSKTFKNWLITTAMQTMNHQYYCKWFYGEEEISYVMDNNYVLESGESTDTSMINTNGKFNIDSSNKYEKQIFEDYKEKDNYKIIKLNVNGCKGYLGVIYDPSTVSLAVTKNLGVSGQYVTKMATDNNAVLAINGGGFSDPGNSSAGGTPTGITISNGKVVTNGEYGTQTQGGGLIGFDKDNVLVLVKNKTAEEALDMGIRDAVTWGPFLIVNGEPSFIKGNGGWGYAARTAIGQREDGIVLFLVVDSNATRTKGADMVDLTTIMQNYGAVNAANLDGGTSSVMVENGKLINDPIDGDFKHQTRPIADSFIVVEK